MLEARTKAQGWHVTGLTILLYLDLGTILGCIRSDFPDAIGPSQNQARIELAHHLRRSDLSCLAVY